MFESELQSDGITMTFVVENSYADANVDVVFCDPVRLTQIFINLLTNVSLVIRFTFPKAHIARPSSSPDQRRPVKLRSNWVLLS